MKAGKLGTWIFLSGWFVMVQLYGCGGNPNREVDPNANPPAGDGGTPPGGNGNGGNTTPPVSNPNNNANGLPAITKSFSLTGAEGTSPSFSTTISTDNLLKIRVKAEMGDRISLPATGSTTYSNFTSNYSCVSYTITALGQSLTTQALSIPKVGNFNDNMICQQSQNTEVLDFSGRLSPGHNSVTIQVKVSGYDFYCKNCYQFPYLYNAAIYGCSLHCPLKTVFKNHTIRGSIAIQVNGTVLN